MRWTRWMLIWLAAALAGCASNGPSTALAEGPRMIDLYRDAPPTDIGAETEARCRWWLFARPCERPGPETESKAIAAEEPSYARAAASELELLFPRLPNPDIYIYVTPHLATGERVPVPGYTTAVPLYELVEYALPGELERRAPAEAHGRDARAGSPRDSDRDGAEREP